MPQNAAKTNITRQTKDGMIASPHTVSQMAQLTYHPATVEKVEGDVSRSEPTYVLKVVRHDDVISNVFAWHIGDPASRIGYIHACLQPPG